MAIKYERLIDFSKVSRVIAVMMVSAILATSSLVLNIGVAEATHDPNATISGSISGMFVCTIGRTGSHQASGSFDASTQPGSSSQGYGRVNLFALFGGFPLLFDNIDNAPSISSSTFTLSGTVQSGPQYCNSIADGRIYNYEITGPCGNQVPVTVRVFRAGESDAGGTLTGSVQCHPAGASNQLPTANAGADQTVIEGSTVTLDGGGSTDPDRDTLTYSWVQTSGTNVTLSNMNAARPTFTAPSVSTTGETLNFELTVNDGKGGTSKDSVSIVVKDDVPAASLTANPTSINEGEYSSLDASGSSSSAGISTYEFTQTAGTEGTITPDSTNGALATFTAPQVVADEIATIQVRVIENDGDSNIATANIAVRNLNNAPVAENQAVTTDEDTALAIPLVATDPDGDALTYTIIDSPLHGTLSGTAPDVTYDPAANYNGEDSFTFIANDGTADSNIAQVSITVRPGNDNPTIDALVADPTTIDEGGGTSQLAASATDPDGDSLTYSWSQTAGTTGRITVDSTDQSKATFEAASVSADETATIQVIVGDGSVGGTDTETVDITVKNVNQVPLAELTSNPTTINEGQTSALDASGSSDPDSDGSLSYSFAILDNGFGTIRDQTDATDPTAIYEAPSDVSNDQTVTIQVEVNDGNDGTGTATAQILVKEIPAPEVEITRAVDRTGKQIAEGDTTPVAYIRISFEVTSAVAIDRIECSLDGKQPFTSCSSPVVYDKLSRGNHEVTVRAINEAGKTGQDQFDWTVGAAPSRGAVEEQSSPSSSAALEEERGEKQSRAASTEEPSIEDAETEPGTEIDATLTEPQSQEPVEQSAEEGEEEDISGDTR